MYVFGSIYFSESATDEEKKSVKRRFDRILTGVSHFNMADDGDCIYFNDSSTIEKIENFIKSIGNNVCVGASIHCSSFLAGTDMREGDKNIYYIFPRNGTVWHKYIISAVMEDNVEIIYPVSTMSA